MDRIIWQPHFGSRYDFSVKLDRVFAEEMIDACIPLERQTRMNQLANEQLKRLQWDWLNPYTFHQESCFVSQFYLGNNGVWLSAEGIDGLVLHEKSGKPIEYHSHNIDTPNQAYILMALFDRWVEYADILKKV
ncbi:MAG: hypothetical protein Q7S55_05605 [Nanoarchaeota archaeon]|nr:hypothetical protein [Nanoarchaeota archaeon]